MKKLALFLSGAVLAAGCGRLPGAADGPDSPDSFHAFLPAASRPQPMALGGGKIAHVVVIVQENRSFDNLFHGFPGADTADDGKSSTGAVVELRPESLVKPMDISHSHRSFVVEYDGGKMDGFNLTQSRCNKGKERAQCRENGTHPYGYVPRSEIEPYWTMASQYALADRMFQTNEGPSFPAHLYLVSGTSAISNESPLRAAENPHGKHESGSGGCDSHPKTRVRLIDVDGEENETAFPCFTHDSLMGRLAASGLSWRYYEAHLGHGLWNAPDALREIRYGPLYGTDVVAPQSRVLSDVAHGDLASVVWVTPNKAASDHAGVNDGSGPSWVASVVNAIGTSAYWNSTAIFITWDDWGGWYDHVKPPQYNSYELGFRVPLIVVSPYARAHYVSHREHEFGSVLKFAEQVFGVPSLGTTDVRSDNLADCFDFARKPRPFKKVHAQLPSAYFLAQPASDEDPDDDF